MRRERSTLVDLGASTGLEHHVDAVVISGELGTGKPDAEIFQAALSILQLDAGAAVMVGDSVERDMEGAARVGIRGIWRPTARPRGHWETAIKSLSDLPELLG